MDPQTLLDPSSFLPTNTAQVSVLNKADELDPNGYFTMANVGWHYVQSGDYAAARPWFERSLRLQWKSNDMAVAYLEIIKSRLLEAAQKTGLPTGVRP